MIDSQEKEGKENMVSVSSELAWDITSWEEGADLSSSNIQHNFFNTFLNQSLALPASILCRQDQKVQLLKAYAIPAYDDRPFHTIDVGFGPMSLKILLSASYE
jgi:hypothetical protein